MCEVRAVAIFTLFAKPLVEEDVSELFGGGDFFLVRFNSPNRDRRAFSSLAPPVLPMSIANSQKHTECKYQ